jgi:hypothetical protein
MSDDPQWELKVTENTGVTTFEDKKGNYLSFAIGSNRLYADGDDEFEVHPNDIPQIAAALMRLYHHHRAAKEHDATTWKLAHRPSLFTLNIESPRYPYINALLEALKHQTEMTMGEIMTEVHKIDAGLDLVVLRHVLNDMVSLSYVEASEARL